MDGFQRGIRAADVAPVFADYERFLRRALPQAEERQARQPTPMRPQGPFPIAAQEALCRRLSERLGLDFDHARLDRSAHPFSGGTPTDVRITTRYDEADFAQAVLAVVHETGHALYERGLPAAFARQPVGEAAGMAAHESQSLIVEMQACRSDAFLSWLGPELHATFGGDPAPYAPANLARLWRRVERGFIRVDADEMTYPAHVILRFRLEQAMVAGDLAVADLPAAWNEGFAALLGIAAARRRARLPAGHPLVRRRVRLFPQLHAGRDGGGATDGGGAARRPRHRRRFGEGRHVALAGLAAREGARPGQPARLQRPAARGDRQAARSSGFRSAPDRAVSGVLILRSCRWVITDRPRAGGGRPALGETVACTPCVTAGGGGPPTAFCSFSRDMGARAKPGQAQA